jgi:hypothetical protein
MCCQNLLELCHLNQILESTVIEDETMVLYYNHLSKRESMESLAYPGGEIPKF